MNKRQRKKSRKKLVAIVDRMGRELADYILAPDEVWNYVSTLVSNNQDSSARSTP